MSSASGGKTLYVGRIELASLLAAAGLTPAEWAAVAPPAVFMWPGAAKYRRNVVNRILGAAKASRAATINTEYQRD